MRAIEIGWHPIARPDLFFPIGVKVLLMRHDGTVVVGKYSQLNHCFLSHTGDTVAPIAFSMEIENGKEKTKD